MHLINSDAHITDAKVIAREGGTAMRFDMGPLVLIAATALLVIVGACGVVMGLNIARMQTLTERATGAEKQAQLLQYYVNEVDGKLIHAGFIEPRDRWSPEKRKQYEETKP